MEIRATSRLLLQFKGEVLAGEKQRLFQGGEDHSGLRGEIGMPHISGQFCDERFLTRYVLFCLSDVASRLCDWVFARSLPHRGLLIYCWNPGHSEIIGWRRAMVRFTGGAFAPPPTFGES